MQSHTLIRLAQIEQFAERGFAVLKQVIVSPQIEVYATYAVLHRFTGHYTDVTETKSKDRYADVLGESLLLHLQPMLEFVSGCKILPAYSFLRIYSDKAVMKKNADLAKRTISASPTLGYQAPALWPLWVDG